MTMGLIDKATWSDHNGRYSRTWGAVERGIASTGFGLTYAEFVAVHDLVEHIGDLIAESENEEQISEKIAALLVEDGRVLPRLLAAHNLEYILMGDGRRGVEHVQPDGPLGSAVAGVVAILAPMARNRPATAAWYQHVWGDQPDDREPVTGGSI